MSKIPIYRVIQEQDRDEWDYLYCPKKRFCSGGWSHNPTVSLDVDLSEKERELEAMLRDPKLIKFDGTMRIYKSEVEEEVINELIRSANTYSTLEEVYCKLRGEFSKKEFRLKDQIRCEKEVSNKK